MKQAMIIASTASMILQFNMNNIKLLQKLGYRVVVACNFNDGNSVDQNTINELKNELRNLNIQFYGIPIPRNPFAIKSILISYRTLKKLSNEYFFDIMHCHSPIGAAIARMAFKKSRKKGTRIIYTAHGFHFYSGSPLRNWILYYPIEYILSSYTDVLITINQEDYQRAQKFKAKKIEYIPGVGINLDRKNVNRVNSANKRHELNIPLNAFLMLSVGELNDNKNHVTVLKAMALINSDNLYYIVCGQGKNFYLLNSLAKQLNISERVKILGFRTDVNELYQCADIYLFPSYREGLSVSLMEAMSYQLPCIVSNIRGNTDLIDNEKGGYTVSPNNINGFKEAIEKAINNDIHVLGNYNINKIQAFSLQMVSNLMYQIYFNN